MNKKNYNVEVLVNGRKAREYQKDDMTFIEGREGTQYQIRVSNNSNRRILARITVDGNSVITDSDDDSGYIINANDSLKLKGFRLNEDEVSAFVFSKKGDSRAQKRFGYAKDCGVIGVQIVKEEETIFEKLSKLPTYASKPTQPMFPDVWYSTGGTVKSTFTAGGEEDNVYSCRIDNNIMSPRVSITECDMSVRSCSAEPQLSKNTFDMGTGMGDTIKSPVDVVDFDAESSPDATFELYYASQESLRKNKITEKPKDKVHIPRAFCKKV